MSGASVASAQSVSGVGVVESGSGAGETGVGRSNAIIGLGFGLSPDYEGSDVYKYGAVPFARFSYQEYQQYLQLGPNPGSRTYQARINVLPYEGIEMGPMIDYRPGRKHVGNKAVRSLPNVDNGYELGGFANYWLPLPGDVLQSIGLGFSGAADASGAYDGWWVQPALSYKVALGDGVSLNSRVFSDYANDDYMSTYFGIDANQAAKSGLKQKNADADFKDVGLTLGVNWQFADHWFTGASGTYERMLGDAASSPVTRNEGNKNQGFGGVYVGYKF
ncbi:MAG: MipA/OmpV family protein [Rhodospirillales bacterium]|nr:MipA/OmpV family protein [Rhodospirillales bacterium]